MYFFHKIIRIWRFFFTKFCTNQHKTNILPIWRVWLNLLHKILNPTLSHVPPVFTQNVGKISKNWYMTCFCVFGSDFDLSYYKSCNSSASDFRSCEHISFKQENKAFRPPLCSKKKKGVKIGFFMWLKMNNFKVHKDLQA